MKVRNEQLLEKEMEKKVFFDNIKENADTVWANFKDYDYTIMFKN